MVLGGILAPGALFFIFVTNVLIWRLLCSALFALGADFVMTGIRGYCPLYKSVGWSTAAPEK